MNLQFTNEYVFTDSEPGLSSNLSRILDIKVDEDENLYLADDKREGVLKFSPSGTLLKEIGRRGQGPGEFQMPNRLFISPRNNLYVLDSEARKISKFDPRGVYQATIPIKETPVLSGDFFVDSLEYVFLFIHDFNNKSGFQSLSKFDAQGTKAGSFAQYLEERLDLGPGLMGGIIHPFTPRVFLCSRGSRFYFGCSTEDRIFTLNEEQKKVPVAQIKEKPASISAEEKSLFKRAFRDNLSQLKLPSARPFYTDILCDEKDRIYLVRTKSILDKGPSVTMDILSKNGDFLYRAQSPFAPKLIRFGKIYVIEYGETGEGRIRRLEIRGYSDWKY